VIQDLTFDGVVATGNASAGLSVLLSAAPTGTQEGIQFSSCAFSGNKSAGVELYTANHVRFTDCAINDNGYAGISTDARVNHLSVCGGVILRNKARGIFGTTTTMNDWLISGVKILDNVGYGVSLSGTGSRFIIESNTVGNDATSSQLYGISTAVATLTNVSVLDNDVRNNMTYGICLTDDTASRVARGNTGYNPRGPVGPPTLPASGGIATAIPNPYGADCTVYISGGTGVNIVLGTSTLGWITTGISSGAVRVLAGISISLGSYTVAPTWRWFAE
jgi:hypothetical protein